MLMKDTQLAIIVPIHTYQAVLVGCDCYEGGVRQRENYLIL